MAAHVGPEKQTAFHVHLKRVYGFDTKAETFEIRMTLVQYYWKEFPYAECPLVFPSAVSSETLSDAQFKNSKLTKPGVVTHVRHLQMKIYESLELRSFPFDVQDLPIKFYCIKEDIEITGLDVFMKDGSDAALLSPLSSTSFALQLPEFTNAPPVVITGRLAKCDDFAQVAMPYMTVHLKVVRSSSAYMKRYCLVMCLTMAATFAVYSVDDHDDRISFVVALLFAVVAFQLMVSSFVPVIEYLTVMDQYALLQIEFTIFQLASVAVIPSEYDSDAMLVGLAVFMAVHVYIITVAVLAIRAEREKIHTLPEYTEKQVVLSAQNPVYGGSRAEEEDDNFEPTSLGATPLLHQVGRSISALRYDYIRWEGTMTRVKDL